VVALFVIQHKLAYCNLWTN